MYKFLIGELFDMEQVTDVNLTVEQYTSILTSVDNLLFEYRLEDISTVQMLGNGNIQINIFLTKEEGRRRREEGNSNNKLPPSSFLLPPCFYIDVRNIEKHSQNIKIDVFENR